LGQWRQIRTALSSGIAPASGIAIHTLANLTEDERRWGLGFSAGMSAEDFPVSGSRNEELIVKAYVGLPDDLHMFESTISTSGNPESGSGETTQTDSYFPVGVLACIVAACACIGSLTCCVAFCCFKLISGGARPASRGLARNETDINSMDPESACSGAEG